MFILRAGEMTVDCLGRLSFHFHFEFHRGADMIIVSSVPALNSKLMRTRECECSASTLLTMPIIAVVTHLFFVSYPSPPSSSFLPGQGFSSGHSDSALLFMAPHVLALLLLSIWSFAPSFHV